jgi:hypothetical protein
LGDDEDYFVVGQRHVEVSGRGITLVVMSVAKKAGALPSACSLDSEALDITDNNVLAAQRTGSLEPSASSSCAK